MTVSGAVVSTVHDRRAGATLTFPARSTAHARNVRVPSDTSCGNAQAPDGVGLSSEHWNVAPVSLDESVKVAVVSVVVEPGAGPPSIATVGRTVSTVHVR